MEDLDTKATRDDIQLAELGHAQSFNRQFTRWSMLGLAFAILNSWTALAASLSLALPSGGPVAVIWGLVTAGICNLSLAASLGEFLSAYPTAGGQYHWVAAIAPSSLKRGLSWVTGWINVSGWVALVATNSSLASTLIINIIALEVPSYQYQRWHQFLIFLAVTILDFVVNAYMHTLLPRINNVALVWSLAGFLIISITLLATAAPDYASAEYVFGTFMNSTGWPDGVAWLLGLLQGGLGLTGFDAVAHMIEEIPNAAVEGPKIMIYCQLTGISTGFVFLVVVLFVSGGTANIEDIVTSSAGPLLEIFYLATKSKVGAVCLLMFPLVCFLFAGVAVMTTSSRMTFAFARDGGLPVSRLWWKIDPKLGVHLPGIDHRVQRHRRCFCGCSRRELWASSRFECCADAPQIAGARFQTSFMAGVDGQCYWSGVYFDHDGAVLVPATEGSHRYNDELLRGCVWRHHGHFCASVDL
jgi:choline transport protein